MNIEDFRTYCLSKPGVEEGFPFGEGTLVLKVMGKVFALSSLTSPWFQVNLKCDPERAIELREEHESIIPGFHMNKKHWNTITFEYGNLSDKLVLELTNHSYDLVVSKLTKKLKEELNLII